MLLMLMIFSMKECNNIIHIQTYIQDNVNMIIYIIKKEINIMHFLFLEITIVTLKQRILNFMESVINELN